MRRHSKSLILALAVALCLPLVAAAASGPSFTQVIEVPSANILQDAPKPAEKIDLGNLSVLLDGSTYSLNDLALLGQDNLWVVATPEVVKSGVAPAFHSEADVAAFLGPDAVKGCPGGVAPNNINFCRLCTGTNCSGTCFVVNCGTCALNLPSIRSIERGCNLTVTCPSSDCTGSCPGITGTTGCFNLNGFVAHSGGCVR